jgi:Na+/H+ antiporter NhaD/arsenite permease-like protein
MHPGMTWAPSLLAVSAGAEPHPAAMLPFAALLLSIALMPFINKEWWHHHYPKVSVGLGAITTVYYIFVLGGGSRMLHVAHEYVSFIVLIGSLFVVSGGIHLQVGGRVRPSFNCVILFAGAVLANLIGTTGASMLLIRPWIRMNQSRISAFHIVFFIFIVSNVGGCLTPIGDPPLFLGYLKGVPFWWVLEHCWQAWLIGVIALIAMFYWFDSRNFATANGGAVVERETSDGQWRFEGGRNLALLAVVLGAVFVRKPIGLSEALMVGASVASWFGTPKRIHEANQFTFEPIREVAWLFAGIFATMVPALEYLETHATELGLNTAAKLYWLTGLLSGALDNAPTYLTFLAASMGNEQLSLNNPNNVQIFASTHGDQLVAISIGAVFFGALTYIGNGPNFMVKSIAEHSGVRTPTFSAYLFRFALPMLGPVLLLIWFLFFSRWRVF